MGRSHRLIDRQVSLGRSRLILHWIDKIPKKRTFFNKYFRKYIKSIHQLVGLVYSLVPIAVADHRLAWQIIA